MPNGNHNGRYNNEESSGEELYDFIIGNHMFALKTVFLNSRVRFRYA